MQINEPRIDYIRLGTWNTGMFYYWPALIRDTAVREGTAVEPKKFLQYQGMGTPWAFCGVAKQGPAREAHVIFQASGERSHDLGLLALALAYDVGGGKCTRIDLQVTVPMDPDPLWWDRWYEFLTRARWGHKRPKIEPIPGDRGMSTLYIGGRKSARFTRFYVKEDDEGNRYLRYEVQYGRDMAQKVWERVRDPSKIRKLLAGDLARLPLPRPGGPNLARLRDVLAGEAEVVPSTVHEGGKTWAWINEAVDPAVKRLLGDHEHGQAMRERLAAWLEYASHLDRLS